MIAFANCKINLGLWVLEKLSNGYHRIETIMIPVPLADIIEIIAGNSHNTKLTLSGLELDSSPETNLCYKAWQLMNRIYGIPPVRIHLHKMVPSGAGLGGGSSDAAFTLKTLNKMFDLGLNRDMMHSLAANLGMDCPFFIDNIPALATGKGEVLHPIPVSLYGNWIVIIKPPAHISTADAYAGVAAHIRQESLLTITDLPKEKWRRVFQNDFTDSVCKKYPEIGEIISKLYEKGAYYAQMSGSGSAVYGLFSEAPPAFEVQESYFCYTTYLGAATSNHTATML